MDENPTNQTTLPAHQLRAIAVEAEVDPRTVRRLLRGERVLALPAQRIRRALLNRGLAHLLSEDQGDGGEQ